MKKLLGSLLDVAGIASSTLLFFYSFSLFVYVFSSVEYPGDIARLPRPVLLLALVLSFIFFLRLSAKERGEEMARGRLKAGNDIYRMSKEQRKRLGIA